MLGGRRGRRKGAFSIEKSTASRVVTACCSVFGLLCLLVLWYSWSSTAVVAKFSRKERAAHHADNVHIATLTGDYRSHLQAEMHSYHAAASSVSQVRRALGGLGKKLSATIEKELGAQKDDLVRHALSREIDAKLLVVREGVDALLDPLMAEMDRGAAKANDALIRVQHEMSRALEEEQSLAWDAGDTSDESAKHLHKEVVELFEKAQAFFRRNEARFISMPEEVWKHCLQLRHTLDGGDHGVADAERVHAELAALAIEAYPNAPSPREHRERFGVQGVGSLLDEITFNARAKQLSESVGALEKQYLDPAHPLTTMEAFRLLEEDPELHYFIDFMGEERPATPSDVARERSAPSEATPGMHGYSKPSAPSEVASGMYDRDDDA